MHSNMGLSCFANELSTFLQEQDCCEAKGHSYILGHGKKSVNQDSQMDIWDREYMELIGIGAAELYDKHNQRTKAQPHSGRGIFILQTMKKTYNNRIQLSRVFLKIQSIHH
nr:hypothetical protein Iba_chr13dCG4280 [Ipomoea batatas]